MKFGRTYNAQVYAIGAPQGSAPVIEFAFPLTIDIDVSRSILSDVNHGTIKIKNLGTDKRALIQHSPFDAPNQYIQIHAGYLSDSYLPLIGLFQNFDCKSYRAGPDWITEMTGLDTIVGIQQGSGNFNLTAGQYSFVDQITQIVGLMPGGVTVGYVSPVAAPFFNNSADYTFSGDPWDEILDLAYSYGMVAYIDLGKIYVVPGNNYAAVPNLGVPILTISAETGLLNEPRFSNYSLQVEMLFEPRAQIGAVCQVITAPGAVQVYNRNWVIGGIQHQGTISAAVGGQMKTTLTMRTPISVDPSLTASSNFAGIAA